MVSDPFENITHAVKKAGETVASTVIGAATTVLHVVSDAAQSGGPFVSKTFHCAVKDAKEELDAAQREIQSVVNSVQKTVLYPLAAKKVEEYADIIKPLVKAWPRVLSRLGSDIDVLRSAVSQERVSPKAAEAMNRLAMSSELRETLSKAADKSLVSFAVEFGGDIAAVERVNGALGFVAETKNTGNVKRYGSVGLSLGVSAGAAGDLGLGLYTSTPQNYGGPFIAVMLQGALDIGGGIVVSFGLPDLSFGGFAVTVSAGEKINISVGGGYTFVLTGQPPNPVMKK
jgi:hypothetical protein